MTRANSDRTRRHDDTERDHCTRELFEQLLTSDCPSQRTEARDQILKLHLDLSDALAGRYARKGIDRDDLVQVARLGLLHAINRYRPDRGSFVGFAIPTITGELKRHFRDHGWTVRPPRRLQELRLRYLAAQDEATQQGSTTPPDGDLLKALQIDRRTLSQCRNLSAAYSPLSLDRTFSDESDDTELTHRLWSVDEDLELLPIRLSLRQAIARLSPRQRSILNWRFGEECTQREIATRLGISQMQVSRILTQIVTDLRVWLADDGEAALAS